MAGELQAGGSSCGTTIKEWFENPWKSVGKSVYHGGENRMGDFEAVTVSGRRHGARETGIAPCAWELPRGSIDRWHAVLPHAPMEASWSIQRSLTAC